MQTIPRLKVVVGVDGSEGSAKALLWAIKTAQRLDAEVIAFHAEPTAVYLPARWASRHRS